MKDGFERVSAWREAINLDLLNAAIQLVLTSTTQKENVPQARQSLQRYPWYAKVDAPAFFSESGLLYIGELLERYEEKYGSERKHLRAVALALAFSLPCQESSMFIGSQRSGFMKKLHKEAKNDLYLQCALYLLEPARQKYIQEDVIARKYTDIAAILFALTIMPTELFPKVRPQLLELVIQKRKLPVYGNSGLYATLIRSGVRDIKANRGKDAAAFKALLALCSGYVRSGSKADVALQSQGFTRHEICFLNLALMCEDGLPDQLRAASIPAEKLAMEYVTATINAHDAPCTAALELLGTLLGMYRRWEIKVEGYCGILEAVRSDVSPRCPEMLAWMTQNIQENYDCHFEYWFDVLDPRWDALHALVPAEKYHELFRTQMKRVSPDEFTRILDMSGRYEKLTGTHYVEAFNTYDYDEQPIFDLLTNAGIIELSTFFTGRKDAAEKSARGYTSLDYIRRYAERVDTRKAYEFWQWFFAQYSVRDYPRFFGADKSFDRELIKQRNGWYGGSNSWELTLSRRDFTDNELRQVYEWADESFFCFHPDLYAKYQSYALQNDLIRSLYTPEELRQTFEMLQSTTRDVVTDALKRLYYTETEKQREADEAARRKILAQQAEVEKAYHDWQQKIEEGYNGTMKSAEEIMARAWNNKSILAELLMPKVMALLESCAYKLQPEEVTAFLRLSAFFYRYVADVWPRLRTAIMKLEEVNPDGSSTTAGNAVHA